MIPVDSCVQGMISARFRGMNSNHTLRLHPATGRRRFTLIRRIILASSFLVVAGAMSSCHTTAGFGRDMEHAGKAIENTATDVHNDMHREG